MHGILLTQVAKPHRNEEGTGRSYVHEILSLNQKHERAFKTLFGCPTHTLVKAPPYTPPLPPPLVRAYAGP